MHLTGSIVIFVSVVPRHICVRHRTKASLNVVLHGSNVKVNVVNPQPLTLP